MYCHFFLQGIFLTQGLNPCLLHWLVNSLQLSHQVLTICKLLGIWKKIQHSSCEVELKCSWIFKIRWASLVFHSSHISCSFFVNRIEIYLLSVGLWKDFLHKPSRSPLRSGRWGDLSDKSVWIWQKSHENLGEVFKYLLIEKDENYLKKYDFMCNFYM